LPHAFHDASGGKAGEHLSGNNPNERIGNRLIPRRPQFNLAGFRDEFVKCGQFRAYMRVGG